MRKKLQKIKKRNEKIKNKILLTKKNPLEELETSRSDFYPSAILYSALKIKQKIPTYKAVNNQIMYAVGLITSSKFLESFNKYSPGDKVQTIKELKNSVRILKELGLHGLIQKISGVITIIQNL